MHIVCCQYRYKSVHNIKTCILMIKIKKKTYNPKEHFEDLKVYKKTYKKACGLLLKKSEMALRNLMLFEIVLKFLIDQLRGDASFEAFS